MQSFIEQVKLTYFSKLKLFLALSRTPHGLLDMTTPCFGACLCLGAFPSLGVILLGLLTVFAGYTAVYSLNDIVDYRVDKKKIKHMPEKAPDIDAAFVSHPMARGLLSFKEGLLWSISWGIIAFTGAYILNPVCAYIFIGGCILEAFYCLMLTVSPLRTIINGIVKTLGTIAAVFAVDPNPSYIYLTTLFFTLFFWEIGGQNIPNDCTDIEEDKKINAQTVPVVFGLDFCSFVINTTLTGAFILSLMLLTLSKASFSFLYFVLTAAAGIYLLLIPGFQFYKSWDHKNAHKSAMNLFNKASYYPGTLFIIVLLRLIYH